MTRLVDLLGILAGGPVDQLSRPCACGSPATTRTRTRRDGTKAVGRACSRCQRWLTMAWRDKDRARFNASRRATYRRSKVRRWGTASGSGA